MGKFTFIASALLLASCGGRGSSAPQEPVEPEPPTPSSTDSFANPGGMWMPHQLAAAEHQSNLSRLGFELDPKVFADPMAPPLAAVVSLGGCSASFISPDGLIITNHHCVSGALRYHSTPEQNLARDGFVATSREEERWNGPDARVWVTQKLTDVTSTIREGLEQITDDRARYDAIEAREKALVASCEQGRPQVHCKIASFFRGAEYQLIEKLELRDIRLVYAPPRSVGSYGGDIDNWMWPRHSGDFAMYRAYVAPDQSPAEHAAENVPYRPAQYLRVSHGDLDAGDLVIVAGYPGQTERLATAAELDEALNWHYPRRLEQFPEYLAALDAVARADEAAAVKAVPFQAGLNNYLKKSRGVVANAKQGNLLARKRALEAELRAWIGAEGERRAKYGEVLEQMEALDEARREHRERDAALREMYWSRLLGAARTIVRMAEERAKPDAEREPGYQERDLVHLVGEQRAWKSGYHEAIDTALLSLALERAARDPETNSEWLSLIVGPKVTTGPAIRAAVAKLYAKSKLPDEATRVRLLTGASTAQLKRSNDPFIQLALRLRPLEREIEEADDRFAGEMALLEPRYLAALREMAGGELAPDANGTLRVSYGTIRGYRPRPEAELYEPFTTLSGVIAKHTGEEPFDAPLALRQAAAAGKRGPYVDPELDDVPVDFLADLDITGGNSGSPILNRRGELVGLLFDTNYEGVDSDWLFAPERTRSIQVDTRYLLWMLDAVAGADHLLRELGFEPAIAEGERTAVVD